jgi:tetratricopeptide (TPR) repeat protein
LKVDFAGQILERWPRSGYEAITFGETARKTGDWSEAERYFLLAANSQISDSFRARAFRFLGEVYIETNRSAAAIGALRSAIGIDPHCGVKRVLASLERNDTTRGSHTSHIRS